MLTTVNPRISYNTKTSGRQVGIGICLKEFLLNLDKYGISHEPENSIRLKLRKNGKCVTRSKQYFLRETSKMHFISRKCLNDIKCKTCICIPKENVPAEFLQQFKEGILISLYNKDIGKVTQHFF